MLSATSGAPPAILPTAVPTWSWSRPQSRAEREMIALSAPVLDFRRELETERGEALNFKNDRLNFLMQQPVGILQRVELAFACGNGDFAGTQLRLGLMKAGLQLCLLALQRSLLPARFSDTLL